MQGAGACYHCISRVVAGERLLGPEEKDVLRGVLERTADFCGIQVLAFALMDNHFHLLVHVPKGDTRVSDAELVRRCECLYRGKPPIDWPRHDVLEGMLAAGGREANLWRKRLRARMHDLSAFMQILKQRFAIWYNNTHDRFGTLWAERFKSILVQGSVRALTAVAAYVDLNPVRAGMVEDPAEYRWCSYAEAVAAAPHARGGLRTIFHQPAGRWADLVAAYRAILLGKGSQIRPGKARIHSEVVARVLSDMDAAGIGEAIRHRLRALSDGLILGSAVFVQEMREKWATSHSPGQTAHAPPVLARADLAVAVRSYRTKAKAV